jgi:hypothetical protein
MAHQRFASRTIICFDREGARLEIPYTELLLPVGERASISLAEYLTDEEEKVWELRRSAMGVGKTIDTLNDIYHTHIKSPYATMAEWKARTRYVDRMIYRERLRLLNSYYLFPRTEHGRLLDEVMEYLMCGSEGDHSAHELSLIRFALDYTLRAMRHSRRRTGVPAAFHSVESARGAAKNGQSAITIIGALFHDVLEDVLDDFTDAMVASVIEAEASLNERYGSVRKVPVEVRLDIIRRHLDIYNGHASGIYYAIGLHMFSHIRLFPFEERYYQFLNSLMAVVENLSRTRDTSYFRYIQKFMFPKRPEPDDISRLDLLEAISAYYPHPEAILDEYLEKVEGFYTTPYGTFTSQEELQRNAFREILCKILDRLNNTRDMDRHYFSSSRRLYGAGFKNLYIIQAIEDKMKINRGMRSEERRLIERKFLNKPKVAALYQILDELDTLEAAHGVEHIRRVEDYLHQRYLASSASREVRRERSYGKHFWRSPKGTPRMDGLMAFFTRVVLGDKAHLDHIDEDPMNAIQVSVAFRALFEAFLVYPVKVEAERAAQIAASRRRTRFKPFRIRGLNAKLEEKVHVDVHRVARELNIKSFRRTIVG